MSIKEILQETQLSKRLRILNPDDFHILVICIVNIPPFLIVLLQRLTKGVFSFKPIVDIPDFLAWKGVYTLVGERGEKRA